MEYFCLIYPDAVFNGIANKVVEQFSIADIEIAKRIVRRLSFEEACAIFYARRLNKDFKRFCKAMTSSSVWLLRLSYDGDLAETLAHNVHPDLIGEFFIPTGDEDNLNFIRLVEIDTDSKKVIEDVIEATREKIARKDYEDDLYFTGQAMRQGSKLYSYFIAMRVSGFNEDQSFELTRNVQMFLFEKELDGSSLDDEDDDDDEDDNDMDGIDDDDDPSDAHDGNGD